jgi:hypothetical protein
MPLRVHARRRTAVFPAQHRSTRQYLDPIGVADALRLLGKTQPLAGRGEIATEKGSSFSRDSANIRVTFGVIRRRSWRSGMRFSSLQRSNGSDRPSALDDRPAIDAVYRHRRDAGSVHCLRCKRDWSALQLLAACYQAITIHVGCGSPRL